MNYPPQNESLLAAAMYEKSFRIKENPKYSDCLIEKHNELVYFADMLVSEKHDLEWVCKNISNKEWIKESIVNLKEYFQKQHTDFTDENDVSDIAINIIKTEGLFAICNKYINEQSNKMNLPDIYYTRVVFELDKNNQDSLDGINNFQKNLDIIFFEKHNFIEKESSICGTCENQKDTKYVSKPYDASYSRDFLRINIRFYNTTNDKWTFEELNNFIKTSVTFSSEIVTLSLIIGALWPPITNVGIINCLTLQLPIDNKFVK